MIPRLCKFIKTSWFNLISGIILKKRKEKNGENVNVIKGTLDLGTSQFNPENKYQINGTLTKHGEYYY